ncbi:hypothetical protein D3C73_724730 [compost metagenome]
MQHGDVHAAQREAGCRFEAEKPATDDDGLGARLCGKQHGIDIVEIAIRDDARQILARNGNNEGHRAGGNHQLVVALRHTVIGGHGLGIAIDGDDLMALVERNAMVDVPAVAMNDDLLVGLFT